MDADERAQLRAKLAQAKNDVPRYWADRQVSVTLGEVARLLDDVERAEEAAALHYEARVGLQKERDAERARADRLEAALRALLHEVDESGNGTAKDFGWPAAVAMSRAALADPAPEVKP